MSDTSKVDVLDIAPVYLGLRALSLVADQGWWRYVAGNLSKRTHVMARQLERFPIGEQRGGARTRVVEASDTLRTLIKGESPNRDEPFWWALGVADFHGRGELVVKLEREQLPDLVPVDQAAALMPSMDRWGRSLRDRMTADGITYNINRGTLYPLYGPHRTRYLFVDQLKQVTATRLADMAARDEDLKAADRHYKTAERLNTKWLKVRGLFPPATRISDLGFDVTPGPSPDPLPVRQGQAEANRRLRALLIGSSHGWYAFQHPIDRAATGPCASCGLKVSVEGMESLALCPHCGAQIGLTWVDGTRSYLVRLPNGKPRILPGIGVLPWVLGMADSHGAAAEVAYRPDLG